MITPFVAVAMRLAARVRWIDLERAEREDMLAAAEAWDRVSPKTPSPSPEPVARVVGDEVEQFVASTTAPPEESPRRETPPQPEGFPRPPMTLLEALRTQPRSEWRALVREEGRRAGPRDDVDVLLGLLENVLRSD